MMNHYIALLMNLVDTSLIPLQLLLAVGIFSAVFFLVKLVKLLCSAGKTTELEGQQQN